VSLAGYSDHTAVSAIRYEQPKLSVEDPITFSPKGLWTPTIDPDNIAYRSMFQPFNLNQYIYPRPPIDMGLSAPIHGGAPNVLRMPLKFPGTEYRVPRAMEALLPLIQRVAEYEKFLSTDSGVDSDTTFCHITSDFSNVDVGGYHRYPGFHGDGIQGTKLTPKVYVEHSYIITSSPPTEFCLQPFFLKHLDEAKHNYFLEFDRQAKEANVYGSIPYHLYLIDPYMVHRTPKIKRRTSRWFLRITYAFTELQHPKNTINPLFAGQEYDKRIDIRENLMANEFEVPWHLYGLTK
jgi:hypothetical protein